jgi:UTP:GlnB (protein PII) uridylyltransferase
MALQTHAANVENFEAAVFDVFTLTQTQEKKFDNPAEVVITGVCKWK